MNIIMLPHNFEQNKEMKFIPRDRLIPGTHTGVQVFRRSNAPLGQRDGWVRVRCCVIGLFVNTSNCDYCHFVTGSVQFRQKEQKK